MNIALGDFSLDVALDLPGRGVTALFGHSGSGKTTILRAIAGLQPFDGTLVVDGEPWQQGRRVLPVHRRPLGYVFQEASLFPHLSVRENLLFGHNRIAKKARRLTLQQVTEWLGLEPLLQRGPQGLSGGERQRVAIGRALLTSPRLLLMDEPLSALDEQSKREILPYLERLHDDYLPIPVLYVSHSLSEVARLADQMVWLKGGRVVDSGPVQAMLTKMELALCHGEEAAAVLDTVVAGHDEKYHLTALDCRFGRLWVRSLPRRLGEGVRVRIPARDVSLSLEEETQSSILNIWRAEVVEIAAAEPGQVLVKLCCPGRMGEQPLLARITSKSHDRLGLHVGLQLYARIKSVGLLE
ncbi:MAG: molybdenum ABC transporter ATP-binding protein [Gammaproteobacteria bacterium]|nr:molybdenum ABC transporter ATP-binding protein [Gammaproteobacteria bacterium]